MSQSQKQSDDDDYDDHSHFQAPPPPYYGGGSPQYRRAPVSDPQGLIDALHDEYVQRNEGAVGDYLESGVPRDEQRIIDSIEDRIRNSYDKEEEIRRLQAEWGVRVTRGVQLEESASE